MLPSKGFGLYGEEGFLAGGAADTRSKMRPDMVIMEMTAAEQQRYLHHANSGSGVNRIASIASC